MGTDRWLVTGASGRLGHTLCQLLSDSGCEVAGLRWSHGLESTASREAIVDLTQSDAVEQAIDAVSPSVIVHTAGLTDVDFCEDHPEDARRLHVDATRNVARAAVRSGAMFVHISTDHLWDGTQQMVSETTPVQPINVYAKTKYEAECAVAEADSKYLIIRTNFFGGGRPWRPSFSDWIRATLESGKSLSMFDDAYFTPIESGLLCKTLITLVTRGAGGLYHVAGRDRISKFDFAVRLAEALTLPTALIEAASIDNAGLRAPRPHDMSLATDKVEAFLGRPMPGCVESIDALETVDAGPPQDPLTYSRQCLDDKDKEAVLQVLDSSFLTQGPTVEHFEAAVAERVGAKYAVAVTSGTAALHVACLAAGIGPGDSAVAPTMSFVASANALLYCGADVALVDCDGEGLGVSAKGLSDALAQLPAPKAVVTVDFGGLAAGSEAIRPLAGSQIIIEDACHALGGSYGDGSPVGSCRHTDMTVFSFHPVKPITTGEGGMITTNDPELDRRLRLYRNHGIERSPDRFVDTGAATDNGAVNPWYYEQQVLGFNYRLSDIHAALGLSQLTKLDRFLERRRAIAARYDAAFTDIPEITLYQQGAGNRERSAHHLYIIGLDYAALGLSRREGFDRLAAAGIRGQVHYIPIHRQPYYRDRYTFSPDDFPEADAFYHRSLTLPLYPSLGDDDVAHVIDAVCRMARGQAI